MAEDTFVPETAHFGFTRVANGEPLSKNGWSFTDLDVTKLDQLLYAAFTHSHDGGLALGNPSDLPTLAAVPTGGSLPAATSYFYRVSFIDEHGLETAASDEATVNTPDPISPPTAPSASVETTGGTVAPGIYSYLVTCVDNYAGETTPSSMASAQVIGGSANQIRLDLPDLPTGAESFTIYRSRPGQSQFYLLGSTDTTVYFDTGITEDQSISAPTTNTTNSANSIVVTINDAAFIPLGCTAWRIYRATTAGGYDGNCLVHEVTEGVTDDSTVPLTEWTDTGDTLLAGFPQNSTSTVPHGALLTLNQITGTLPLSAMARGSQALSAFVPGTPVDSTVVNMTDSPADVKPVRLTAYFATAPTDVGVTVRVVVSDAATVPNTVELQCSPADLGVGDPDGYFHTEWPLVEAASFEAEQGTFSDITVNVDNDAAAISGQAVTLDTTDQWVQVHLGTLDMGTYHTFATVRALMFDGTVGAGDVHVQIVNGSGTVLAQTSYNLNQTIPSIDDDYFYQELVGPVYAAPGGENLYLRVRKTDAGNTAIYDVDSMRFVGDVPVLEEGPLTFTTFVDGGATTSADVNITLWF